MSIPSNNEIDQDLHSEDKTTQLMEYVETLVSMKEEQVESENEIATLLDRKFKEFSQSIERQLGEFFKDVELRFEKSQQQQDPGFTAATEETAEASNDDSSPESDWDRRKQEILREHGFVTEEPSTPEAIDDNDPPRAGVEEEDEELNAIHDSIQNMERMGDEELDELKAELTAKIRDAEVELSINRAKLSQQWAALEQKQFEVKQRESALLAKYGDIQISKKKRGLIDRLSRHLSNKSSDYSDIEDA